jgi:histidine triad (HIT) family protein
MVRLMQENDCIFCKIVRGEIPSAKIWEDKKHIAILDIFPNTKGMTLVIPKVHHDSYAFDMPDKAYSDLMLASKKVAKLLDKRLKINRTAMVMEGMGVNHVHIKLYPMHGIDKKFKEMWAKDERYFDTYPGYIMTVLGPKADDKELAKLAKLLSGK